VICEDRASDLPKDFHLFWLGLLVFVPFSDLDIWIWARAVQDVAHGCQLDDGAGRSACRGAISYTWNHANHFMLYVRHTDGLEPSEHVCKLHQNTRGHHRGNSKERSDAALSCVRPFSESTEAVGCMPAGEQGAADHLPQANQGVEQSQAHRCLIYLDRGALEASKGVFLGVCVCARMRLFV
jgi:hypothetical protein